jgi:molybdopterin-biosynthesis enzyme MoeA-like protein
MPHFNFFALIIGTEILNRRRSDKHFDFLTRVLARYGTKLSGSFIIEDEPQLIVETIRLIASQPDSILFGFGGIGSTPDDHTRQCASAALRDGKLVTHPEAKEIIETVLGKDAYPFPILMADLPQEAKLISNPVNQMPAFSLDDRYYFMPGFPEMSHPMVDNILKTLLPLPAVYHRFTLTAQCKENELIPAMRQMPKGVEFSSLPKLYQEGWKVTISVASYDRLLAKSAFEIYINTLKNRSIPFDLIDENNDQTV